MLPITKPPLPLVEVDALGVVGAWRKTAVDDGIPKFIGVTVNTWHARQIISGCQLVRIGWRILW